MTQTLEQIMDWFKEQKETFSHLMKQESLEKFDGVANLLWFCVKVGGVAVVLFGGLAILVIKCFKIEKFPWTSLTAVFGAFLGFAFWAGRHAKNHADRKQKDREIQQKEDQHREDMEDRQFTKLLEMAGSESSGEAARVGAILQLPHYINRPEPPATYRAGIGVISTILRSECSAYFNPELHNLRYVVDVRRGAVRVRLSENKENTEPLESYPELSSIGSAAQRAASMIASHFAEVSIPSSNCRSLQFPNACFYRANLRGVDFSYSCIERGDFRGSILSQASFYNATLSHSDFRNAAIQNVNFVHADLSYSNFEEQSLFNYDFRSIRFLHANLKGVSFIKADGENARFNHANLRDASLSSFNGHSASFTKANLRNSDLSRSEFSCAVFHQASMEDAYFAESKLEKATFLEADLRGACFRDTDCRCVDFKKADLTKANFTGANISGANFEGAILEGCNFEGVKYNTETQWPEGFETSVLSSD